MFWFWLGFFALVALLLFLDLGVLHRKNQEQSLKQAVMWTIGWAALGLAFSGVVYLIYQNHWFGADLADTPKGTPDGGSAAATYVSGYLLEQALSIDNIFVIALTFNKLFKVPKHYQHRILFWGILGAVVFRVSMLGGGVWLAKTFDWVFYLFGAFLAFQGGKILFGGDDDDGDDVSEPRLVKFMKRFFTVVIGTDDGLPEHRGKFFVRINGRRAITTLFICLIAVELTDIVFALDSIPAVLSVSQETFIVVTSNIFAILGLRSLYFVLAGAMAEFKYLEIALGVLLVGIGLKMILHSHVHIGNGLSLIGIASILTIGVVASLIDMRLHPPKPEPEPDDAPKDVSSEPGPTSPSP